MEYTISYDLLVSGGGQQEPTHTHDPFTPTLITQHRSIVTVSMQNPVLFTHVEREGGTQFA